MIVIQGESPRDWIALVAASAISWSHAIRSYQQATGHLPSWAMRPAPPGSIEYTNDSARDVWTFGDGNKRPARPDEGMIRGVLRGDCDTLTPAKGGASLVTHGRARLLTVGRGERGHTFETSAVHKGRGYELWDANIFGGMLALPMTDYNLPANVADIECNTDGIYHVTFRYGIPPLVYMAGP